MNHYGVYEIKQLGHKVLSGTTDESGSYLVAETLTKYHMGTGGMVCSVISAVT